MTSSIIWPKFDEDFTSIWRYIDVILTSFRRHQWCYRWRHLDIKTLTSFWWWNLWSILTSIFTSNVNGKNWRHQLFDQNLTWNWHQFDMTLMSFQHHFDVTNDVIDDVILTSKHWRHFDGEIFSQFWRQFSHQMLTLHQLFDQNLT